MARKGADYIGTMPVQEKHRFDQKSLEQFMASHVRGFTASVAVEQFKGGQSNPTYRLTDGAGRHYVLRRKPPGKLLPSAHAIEREFRVTAALAAAGYPVARPLHLCTDEAVIGAPFFVMAHVEGRIFWQPYAPGRSRRWTAAAQGIARQDGVGPGSAE